MDLKRAIFATSDDDCATKASLLATRWGRGDFTASLGELVAEAKLIALFKDKHKVDVRPISVGCSLRRLLTKAYCSRTRARINNLVKETQLGVLKAGYEVGVHAMRSLSHEASENGEGILLLDFANAFNTVDRNLMISLAAKDCPELTNLTWWLYKLQPWLITPRGDVIRSSTGAQQGCRLSNPLFALTMQFIAGRLKGIKDLRKPLFFWDDTALIGTPEALARATKVLMDCADETGLRLKWRKCHLHALPNTIARCRTLQFPKAMTLHHDFNMTYLQAPIGDDQFVRRWLQKKLQKLNQIVSLVSEMPHKHEAATLLKSSAAVCRVVYLMRILPPPQISAFVSQFDATLRRGFEKILGTPMDDLQWEIAKLPPKYGGMGWKTGSHTYGAHYIASLTKTSAPVCSISPSHATLPIAQRNATEWLHRIAPPNVTIEMMINTIRKPASYNSNQNLAKIKLSIAQQCDEWHWKTLVPKLSDEDLSHVLAHSGSTNWWTTCAPLEYKKWTIAPDKWTAATRLRLHLDVIPAEQQCPYCHWQRCDTKGNHAIMCKAGPSRTWRHNSIRNLLAKAIENVGFKVGFEHNGGLPDDRRPGDIIVYNWTRNKHLLIDVGVTNSLAAHNRSALLQNGPGGGAAVTEKTKRNKYWDLDSSQYTYLPFILETSGAFGKPALQLCSELRKIWLTKCCSGNDSANFNRWSVPSPQHENVDPLLVSISVLLQTHNGQMILERSPLSPKLLDSEIARSEARTKTQRKWAVEELQMLSDPSPSTLRRFSAWTKGAADRTNRSRTGDLGMLHRAPHHRPDPDKTLKTQTRVLEKDLLPRTPGPHRSPPDPVPTIQTTSEKEDPDGGLEKQNHSEHPSPTPPSSKPYLTITPIPQTQLNEFSMDIDIDTDMSTKRKIDSSSSKSSTPHPRDQMDAHHHHSPEAPTTQLSMGPPLKGQKLERVMAVDTNTGSTTSHDSPSRGCNSVEDHCDTQMPNSDHGKFSSNWLTTDVGMDSDLSPSHLKPLKRITDNCDNPNQATSPTKNYGLPRDTSETKHTPPFRHKITPNNPTANRAQNHSNHPTATNSSNSLLKQTPTASSIATPTTKNMDTKPPKPLQRSNSNILIKLPTKTNTYNEQPRTPSTKTMDTLTLPTNLKPNKTDTDTRNGPADEP